MDTMNVRRLLPLLLAAAIATALLAVTPSPANAADPSRDYPRMPRQCATAAEKIPSKPTVCQLNTFDKDRSTVVLWGDSHSWMFIPALKKAAQGKNLNLLAVMMGSCPPMDNQADQDDQVAACFKSNALGIDLARRLEAHGKPYRIVLAGSWQRYLHALKVNDTSSYVGVMAKAMRKGTPRLVRTLEAIGSQVDVIGQVATVPPVRRRCPQGNDPYACSLPRAKALPELGATRTYLRETFKPLLGTRAPIDVNPYICNAKVCKGKVDGVRTWFDDLHLSASMSTLMSSYLARSVDSVAGGPLGGCTLPLPLPIPLLTGTGSSRVLGCAGDQIQRRRDHRGVRRHARPRAAAHGHR